MIHNPTCVKDCADRKQGCHSTCEKFLDWLKVHAREKNTYDANKRIYVEYSDVYVRRNRRIKKTINRLPRRSGGDG